MPWQCHIWRLPLHIEKNTWVKSWAKAGCHTCQKYEYKYKHKWEYNHKYKHEWQRRRTYWKQKSPKIDKEKYKNTWNWNIKKRHQWKNVFWKNNHLGENCVSNVSVSPPLMYKEVESPRAWWGLHPPPLVKCFSTFSLADIRTRASTYLHVAS